MTARTRVVTAICLGVLTIVVSGSWLDRVQGQQAPAGAGFAAVPGLKDGQDIFGPYDVVRNWPKPCRTACPTTRSSRGRHAMIGNRFELCAKSPRRRRLAPNEITRIASSSPCTRVTYRTRSTCIATTACWLAAGPAPRRVACPASR